MIVDLSRLHFDMKRPCATCPFRRDVDPVLHLDEISSKRIARMAPDLVKIPWACHATTTKSEEGRESCNERTQHCAGLLILLEKQGTPHGPYQFIKAIDECPVAELDMGAPVFDSLEELEEAYWFAEMDHMPWRVV